MSLADLLVSTGEIEPAALERARVAAPRFGGRLESALVGLGLIAEARLIEALAGLTGLEIVDLARATPDPDLMARVPSRFIFAKEFLPLDQVNGLVRVATSNPLDVQSLDELRFLLEAEIETLVAPSSQIQKVAREFFGVAAEAIDELVEERREALTLVNEESEQPVLEAAEDRALIRFVNHILMEAVRDRASDVHIEPLEDRLRVRYRIDGVLHETKLHQETRQFQAAIISRIKIMANLNIAERRLPQDGRIKLRVAGREVDVRVSVIPTLSGEDVVLRLLDRQSISFGLEELGMKPDTLETFGGLISEPNGILFVTGPTGSGKTTSLYAALGTIDTVTQKVITLEDPVEYQLSGINQIQVNAQTGLTFARGLRSILRHDPDVVLVGEIRDLETAEIAIRASLTGHLVFSTLHTNDAPSAITRLLDMGIEPFLVASSVEGLMAQRLVRKICPGCKTEASEAERHRAERTFGEAPEVLWIGAGCEHCLSTGYRGRIGIFELAVVDEAMKDMIVRRCSASELRRAARDRGMRTMREDGWLKVKEGATTVDEVLRVTKSERD